VFVSNVQQLYDALNDQANAGAAVVLAPGVYVLSPKDANGVPRPHLGRLELQPDMSLYNACVLNAISPCTEADVASVVIDAGAKDELGKRLLQPSSFSAKFGRTGVIRAGCGSNAIGWLTIVGNPAAAASIETELIATNPECKPLATAVKVAHVVTYGSGRGVDIRNVTSDMAGLRVAAELEDNDFYYAGEGIRVINFAEANNSDITVDMQGNHSHGNVVGCVLENNRSNGASIIVRSYADHFDDNQLGCTMGAGFVNNTSGQTANSNLTRFDAVGSYFTDNTRTSGFNTEAGTPEFTDAGGIVVSGGSVGSSGKPKTANSNTALLRFWDVTIADNVTPDNQGTEFLAFGARSDVSVPAGADPTDYVAGSDNHTLIQLRGLTAFVDVEAVDSEVHAEPVNDPNGTNTIRVVRIY
jgi:hypothetical protein